MNKGSTIVRRWFYAGSTIVVIGLLMAARIAASDLVVVTIETTLGAIEIASS